MQTLGKSIILLVFAVGILGGCATYRPIVDQNAQFEKYGEARAEQEIDKCLAKADQYLAKHKSTRMKKEAGRGAVSGALLGGVVGLMSGGTVRSTAVGAGVGAGVGAVSGAAGVAAQDNLSPDAIKQRFVTNCLNRKGYSVIGWE